MRALGVPISLLLISLLQCDSNYRKVTCKPIDHATRVIVSGLEPAYSDYSITDPDRIRKILAFTNARPEGSNARYATPVQAPISAAIYDGSNFVGAFGVGSNFFTLICKEGKGARDATQAEVEEFKRLIAPDAPAQTNKDSR